jgi:hypothetical protein
LEHTGKILEQKESLAVWASDKDSCSEAPEGATGQDQITAMTGVNPLTEEEHPSVSRSMENLGELTQKVSSLGFQLTKKNRCGAARKRVRKARRLEAPTGDTTGGQPQTLSGDQSQNIQGPSTSVAKGGGLASKVIRRHGAPPYTKTTAVGRRHSGWRAG